MVHAVDHLPCLDVAFITPGLRTVFEARHMAQGRGARSLSAADRWEQEAVTALCNDWEGDSSARDVIQRFGLLSRVLPGEIYDEPIGRLSGDLIAPDTHTFRIMAQSLWLLFDDRGRAARELVLVDAVERRHAAELAHLDDGELARDNSDSGSVIVVAETPAPDNSHRQQSPGSFTTSARNQPFVLPGNIPDIQKEISNRSGSPLTELEDEGPLASNSSIAAPRKGVKRKLGNDTVSHRRPKERPRKPLLSVTEVNSTAQAQSPESRSIEDERIVSLEATRPRKTRKDARSKIERSGWFCRPVPANIMDILRFDHPPILLSAPIPNRSALLSSSKDQDSHLITGGSSNLIKPAVSKPSSVKPKQRETLQQVNDIVPLPSTLPIPAYTKTGLIGSNSHFPPRRGIPSSMFCAVVRLIAELPRPARPDQPMKRKKPVVRPPVWAESRQELCEALPYYRSFQSGLYMSGRVAFGYLLEAFPAPRDVWAQNGKIVISHGGGQCIRTVDENGRHGPPALQADQSSSDARVDALLLAAERQTPIVLIAGAGYAFLPWTLDCAYVVLGWYWISMTWVEGEPMAKGVKAPPDRDYFHRYKIRFDWVQTQGTPWWWDVDKPTASCQLGNPATPEACLGDRAMTRARAFTDIRGTVVPDYCDLLLSSHTDPSAQPFDNTAISTPVPKDLARFSPSKFNVASRVPVLPTGVHGANGHHHSRDEEIYAARLVRILNSASGLLTPPITPPTRPVLAIIGNDLSDRLAVDSSTTRATTRGSKRNMPSLKALSCRLTAITAQERSSAPKATHSACSACLQLVPRIYAEGLICVNPVCKGFWMIQTPIGLLPIPPGFSLTYFQAFMECKATPDIAQKPPYDLIPPPPVSEVPDEAGVGTRMLWKGWVCQRCGRANCRYRWEVWECRNCGNTLAPLDTTKTILPSAFPPLSTYMGDAYINPGSTISAKLHVMRSINATAISYDLPRAGRVWHVTSVGKEIAHDLLERYQNEATTGGWFQRRALKATAVKGPLLAQHFAVNSGASYKYNVDTISFPFESSPSSVVLAHDVVTQMVAEVLGEVVPFNEILSVMYREGQKMSWHDDGEQGLGPVVASLSLGSPAVMSFRAKQPRQELNSGYYNGTGASSSRTAPPTSLSITLCHGDVMIMQGREIQKRFDHRVIPSGFRIAATARVIGNASTNDRPTELTA